MGNRLEDPESSQPHMTARKLGAPFELLIRRNPHLDQAYGRCASEIAASQQANANPLNTYGPFAEHVGASATTGWAAAASGEAATGVRLLAWVLARQLSPPEATESWEELVN
jgi:hypothetical protein